MDKRKTYLKFAAVTILVFVIFVIGVVLIMHKYKNQDDVVASGTEETVASGTEETVASGTEETVASGTEETVASGTEETATEEPDNSLYEPGEDGYSNEQLVELATQYYYNLNDEEPPIVAVDHEEGDMVVIHLFGMYDGHTGTMDWYTVDRYTCEGEDFFGNYINLLEE